MLCQSRQNDTLTALIQGLDWRYVCFESKSIVAAFSEEQVERLTGLTKAQLRYWDKTGFFAPKFADENRRRAYSRLYSFKDVVALRTISILRNQHNVPLQHLRKVAEKLSHLKETFNENEAFRFEQKGHFPRTRYWPTA